MSSWARVRMVSPVTQLDQGGAGDRTWVWHSYRCFCHPPWAREWSSTIPFDFRPCFRFNLSLTKLSVKIQLCDPNPGCPTPGSAASCSLLLAWLVVLWTKLLWSPHWTPLEAHRHILPTLKAHQVLLINTWAPSAIVPQLCQLLIPVP